MDYYSATAKGYNTLHKEEQLAKIQIILANATFTKKQKLLDVGCGTAFSFDYFPCECTGIEPSKGLIDQSKHKDKIIQGTAENLPFENNTFDIVISITATHNFSNIQQGLDEMKRVGKNSFIFSILKKSKYTTEIDKHLRSHFTVAELIDQGVDLIYFCTL